MDHHFLCLYLHLHLCLFALYNAKHLFLILELHTEPSCRSLYLLPVSTHNNNSQNLLCVRCHLGGFKLVSLILIITLPTGIMRPRCGEKLGTVEGTLSKLTMWVKKSYNLYSTGHNISIISFYQAHWLTYLVHFYMSLMWFYCTCYL